MRETQNRRCENCAETFETTRGDGWLCATCRARPHFIYMNGEHGCMPDNCGAVYELESAVSTLADLFELGRNRRRALKRNLYLDLNPRRDGASYCEIIACDCDDASSHDSN